MVHPVAVVHSFLGPTNILWCWDMGVWKNCMSGSLWLVLKSRPCGCHSFVWYRDTFSNSRLISVGRGSATKISHKMSRLTEGGMGTDEIRMSHKCHISMGVGWGASQNFISILSGRLMGGWGLRPSFSFQRHLDHTLVKILYIADCRTQS